MKLVALRTNVGLSRKDVAKKLGVSFATYTNWEQGKCEPRVSVAYKMAKLFGVEITDLDFKR